jgi:hypothetical protein
VEACSWPALFRLTPEPSIGDGTMQDACLAGTLGWAFNDNLSLSNFVRVPNWPNIRQKN